MADQEKITVPDPIARGVFVESRFPWRRIAAGVAAIVLSLLMYFGVIGEADAATIGDVLEEVLLFLFGAAEVTSAGVRAYRIRSSRTLGENTAPVQRIAQVLHKALPDDGKVRDQGT